MHTGSCHCGAIRYEVDGDFDRAVECNCSHCSRKGYLLWFVPRVALRVIDGESAMSSYRFNRHVIDHRFCTRCGCAPFGLGTAPDGRETAAINIRCLDDVDLSTLTRVPFDGRAL